MKAMKSKLKEQLLKALIGFLSVATTALGIWVSQVNNRTKATEQMSEGVGLGLGSAYQNLEGRVKALEEKCN